VDHGVIALRAPLPRLAFNGEEIGWRVAGCDEPTPFLAAFYGARALFGRTAGSVASCWALYGAGVRLGDTATVILGRSGVGKTTLVVTLLARGARFYSDECVFIDKTDGFVDGLPRALMIRERALALLAGIPGVASACRRAPSQPVSESRLWYAVEPDEIFGADQHAESAPLGDLIVLDDDRSSAPSISRMPPSLAAAELARRCHAKPSGLDAFAKLARQLRSVRCHRLRLGDPAATANLIYDACR
jgi:hypothetical protein